MMTEQIEPMMIGKETEHSSASAVVLAVATNRKERRKAAKKEKRKQKRKEVAEKELEEQEALLNDPEEQRRIQLEEEKEKERLERERREFEEWERNFLEDLARRKAREEEEREEEERKRAILGEQQKDREQQVADGVVENEDDEWEYVEEGPPEIIWQGNEIIVKKNKVKVKKKGTNKILDENRPISNPLPPQSEAFADYKNVSTMLSAQQFLEDVAQQTPNFGTEQDKDHCPFHLKTGACRFGSRCSRVHFYPDKSCTLLIKNMYNGPGLAWEQDEGLEYSEEEVERSFEEFYEDVHTEFLKFGELVNFKVCRNGSQHLRGNTYVHYKSLESAMLAYQSTNGRYFAGKQVSCEFVAVTRWKVAICGEYMKSKLKICSRGSACNFIHCFRNPGGDYEWADWDKLPPRYWVEKMTALFGYSDQKEDAEHIWDPIRRSSRDNERYRKQRSQSKQIENSSRTSRDPYSEDNTQRAKIRSTDIDKRRVEEETHYRHHHHPGKRKSYDSDSDADLFNRVKDTETHGSQRRKHSRHTWKKSYDSQETRSNGSHDDVVLGTASSKRRKERHREEQREKSSEQKLIMSGVMDNLEHRKRSSNSTTSSKDQDPSSIDDLWFKKSRDLDSTSVGIMERSHEHRRKSSKNSTEVSMDTETGKISSRKGFEVISIDEHKRPHKEHVDRKCSQSDRHSDSDYSCNSVRTGSRISKKDLHKKSKRKSSSDEKYVVCDHPYKENHTGINVDEDIEQRGRWESEHVDSEREQKRRGKSSRYGSSDEYFDERKSRNSSKSSHKRHRNSEDDMTN